MDASGQPLWMIDSCWFMVHDDELVVNASPFVLTAWFCLSCCVRSTSQKQPEMQAWKLQLARAHQTVFSPKSGPSAMQITVDGYRFCYNLLRAHTGQMRKHVYQPDISNSINHNNRAAPCATLLNIPATKSRSRKNCTMMIIIIVSIMDIIMLKTIEIHMS